MSRKVQLSRDDLSWLKSNHSSHSHADIAERLGVCVDTAKRILMREHLQYFPGAKYQTKPKPKTWTRECIVCGDANPRTKYQYKCDACTEREAEASRQSICDEGNRKQPRKLEIPF